MSEGSVDRHTFNQFVIMQSSLNVRILAGLQSAGMFMGHSGRACGLIFQELSELIDSSKSEEAREILEYLEGQLEETKKSVDNIGEIIKLVSENHKMIEKLIGVSNGEE